MRIDEFSNMASSGVGLSDTERLRFCCFGFDLTAAAPITITGMMRLTASGFAPTILGKGKVDDG